ncbi:HAD family hydrolase [Halanaerobium hydrogeniformans]|uniref:HAD-superfamily hydrolase, subfamily IA, variant 3 n=1 Tax=Halanaerobium hydrogeniformans TaxID=656519 RepID=E4RMZ9_HALHG|nr:HAD family phosphatase [Halanaerobium hydrogeniformans]ADQ14216.1 HAD-superfamily hydrolase, subfamily IA, variant 3 [Halanaerobium hydrogeniformans]
MIKNIVFDLGNVLLDFDPESYLADLEYDEQQKMEIKKAVFASPEWLQLDRGSLNFAEAKKKMIARNPHLAPEIENVVDGWEKILSLKEDTLLILKELAQKDYQLYVLSNFHQKAFAYVHEKYDFFSYFSGIVISSEVGMIKPEKEIYSYLLNEYQLKAEETLFIDDTLANIEAAQSKGIKGIHFQTAEMLKEELQYYFESVESLGE